MVLAHVTDAWTREVDRHDDRYFAAVFVNGLAAPMFMFLAGVALAMAAESRARSVGALEAARSVRRRGWQVFGLAFLFRVQSQLLGWGPLTNILKVDVLNIMGLSMVGAAWIWTLVPRRAARIGIYAAATAVFALLNPVVREMAWGASLPDLLERYIRSTPGSGWFSLFPWSGFLTAGALVGELIDAAQDASEERRVQAGLAAAAIAGIVSSYALSLLPSIYAHSEFWSTSPVFFFIRLGLVVATVPLAWAVGLSWNPLVTLGRSSLFVYWVHVEMVYGSWAIWLKRSLPWELTVVSAIGLCVLLYELVRLKDTAMLRRPLPRRLGFLAPVLR